jgi:hypothetical protein
MRFRTLATRAVLVIALSAGAIGMTGGPAHALPRCTDHVIQLHWTWMDLYSTHTTLARIYRDAGYENTARYHQGLADVNYSAAQTIVANCHL